MSTDVDDDGAGAAVLVPCPFRSSAGGPDATPGGRHDGGRRGPGPGDDPAGGNDGLCGGNRHSILNRGRAAPTLLPSSIARRDGAKQEPFLGAIEQIYRSVTEPACWEMALQSLGRLLDSDACAIASFHFGKQRGAYLRAWGHAPALLDRHGAEFAGINPWLHVASACERESKVWLSEPARLAGTRYYRDWLRPQGFLYQSCGVIRRTQDEVVYLENLRRTARPPFEAWHRARCELVLPHLRRALELIALTHAGSTRRATSPAPARPRRQGAAAARSGRARPQANASERQRWLGSSVTTLCLQRLPTETRLRLVYQLTPAEARLAVVLAHGCTLSQAAQELDVGLNTVRTHLQRIYDKTDTHRQSELIRLLLTGSLGLQEESPPTGRMVASGSGAG